jgi:hypothetical protein
MDIKTNTLSIGLTGLKRAETQAVNAAKTITALGAENAKISTEDFANLTERATTVPEVAAENARAAAVLADVEAGDIAKPLIDLIQAKTAFAASAAAVRMTGDIEREAVNMVGKKV